MRDFRFAVIDIDGTLLNSKKFHRQIIKLFSKLCSGHPLLDSLLYSLCSCTWFSNLPLLKGKQLGRRLDRLIFNLFDFADRRRATPYKGVREVLEYLSKNGVRLFATTVSKTHRIAERLSRLGLLQFFTLVIGGDIVPKSEHILWYANYLNLTLTEFSQNSVYLGDTIHDMTLARSNNIAYTFGITNTLNKKILERAGAMTTVESWEEFLKVLK